MIRYLLAVLFVFASASACAVEGASVEGLLLSHVTVNASDVDSIKRGAKLFATNCMSCHTLKYLRYNKLAAEAGITLDKMPLNVTTWPFGITPPDLSLEADVRGTDWIYTYLHSFYVDSARPTGVNNLLVPNTAMPAILSPYQGEQVLLPENMRGQGVIYKSMHYYDVLQLTKEGSVSPGEFDAMTTDLVNFLDYAAEPFKHEQHVIGYWVLGFLVILFVFMYLLKKEYWKDVKRRRDE